MAHILLVDDDSDVLEAFAALLRTRHHHVRTAGGGHEGLRSLGAGELPDVVVLDVDMPEMSGPAMAHQMLVHDAGQERIPIVLLSGRPDLAAIAARMGTPYAVPKIAAAEDFLGVVERALQERSAPASA